MDLKVVLLFTCSVVCSYGSHNSWSEVSNGFKYLQDGGRYPFVNGNNIKMKIWAGSATHKIKVHWYAHPTPGTWYVTLEFASHGGFYLTYQSTVLKNIAWGAQHPSSSSESRLFTTNALDSANSQIIYLKNTQSVTKRYLVPPSPWTNNVGYSASYDTWWLYDA